MMLCSKISGREGGRRERERGERDRERERERVCEQVLSLALAPHW